MNRGSMNTQGRSPRIIAGIDGSEYSSNALRLARHIADSFDAPLEVITCIGTPDFYMASHLDPGNTGQCEWAAHALLVGQADAGVLLPSDGGDPEA